jgi:hypothetical protein
MKIQLLPHKEGEIMKFCYTRIYAKVSLSNIVTLMNSHVTLNTCLKRTISNPLPNYMSLSKNLKVAVDMNRKQGIYLGPIDFSL